jgi:hypothetical protein
MHGMPHPAVGPFPDEHMTFCGWRGGGPPVLQTIANPYLQRKGCDRQGHAKLSDTFGQGNFESAAWEFESLRARLTGGGFLERNRLGVSWKVKAVKQIPLPDVIMRQRQAAHCAMRGFGMPARRVIPVAVLSVLMLASFAGFASAQEEPPDKQNPVIAFIASVTGTSYEDVLATKENGFKVGQVGRAYLFAELTGQDVSDVLGDFPGKGWGVLFKKAGLHPGGGGRGLGWMIGKGKGRGHSDHGGGPPEWAGGPPDWAGPQDFDSTEGEDSD